MTEPTQDRCPYVVVEDGYDFSSPDFLSKTPCSHPIYQNHGHCIFHSPKVKEKEKNFPREPGKWIQHCETEDSIKFYDFRGFVFPSLNFIEKDFLKPVRFDSGQFSGQTYFNNSQFSGDTVFKKCIFSGLTEFIESHFPVDVDFSESQFSGSVSFAKSQFSGNVDFTKSQFSMGASFGKIQVVGDADFGSSQFSGEASFRKSQFSKNANFRKSQFSELAYFYECQFSGDAYFNFSQGLGVIRKGMVYLEQVTGISFYWRDVAKGVILILAISLDAARRLTNKKRLRTRQ